MIKAIETRYNGHLFRSRLEARWAVFFDLAGIEWLYEFEGYVLDDECYLPDFYLPFSDTFVEIKPKEPNEREWRLARLLSKYTGKDVIFLCGSPYPFRYNLIKVNSDWFIAEDEDGCECLDFCPQDDSYIAMWRCYKCKGIWFGNINRSMNNEDILASTIMFGSIGLHDHSGYHGLDGRCQRFRQFNISLYDKASSYRFDRR